MWSAFFNSLAICHKNTYTFLASDVIYRIIRSTVATMDRCVEYLGCDQGVISASIGVGGGGGGDISLEEHEYVNDHAPIKLFNCLLKK